MEGTNISKLLFSHCSFCAGMFFFPFFPVGYLTTLSVKGLKRLTINDELERIQKKTIVAYSRYYPAI
jgi:hypothetical protein